MYRRYLHASLHAALLRSTGTCSLVFTLGGVEAVSEGDSIRAHGPLDSLYPDHCLYGSIVCCKKFPPIVEMSMFSIWEGVAFYVIGLLRTSAHRPLLLYFLVLEVFEVCVALL